MLHELLYVGVGGAAGSMARCLIASNLLAGFTILGFPAGTFAVNIIGSLIIGIFMSVLHDGSPSQWILITGFCGGFTTFSTFSADVFKMIRAEKIDSALFYIILSVIIAVVFTTAGWYLGTLLKKMFA